MMTRTIHRHMQLLLAAVLSVGRLSSSISLHDGRYLQHRQTDNLPIDQNTSFLIDDRVEDLLRRITLEEKAGQLFHTQLNLT